jgi:PAS domain S-box-containing protein
MYNNELTKEQMVEQIIYLQDKINSLEKIVEIQKHTEDALSSSEKNLSAIIEKNADGIVIVDCNGTVLYVNPAAEKLFNRSKEDFLGYPFGFPVSADREEDTLVIIKGDTLCDVEFRVVQVQWQKRPAFQLSVRDVTKLKQAEEELKKSEEKFKSITENSADAIFITDINGKYVYTNKAVTDMLGFSSEEMKGKTIIDLTPENSIEEHLEIFQILQVKGRIFTEIELLQKDGNIISTDLNSVILPGGLVYGSCRDITERKLAEKELIIAKDKAEESDRLKTAFLHNVSHEIRTPLNAIVGFSGFLNDPDLPSEKCKHFTDIIIQSSDQLLSIITDIISIASIEAGQEKIQENEINVNLICKLMNEQFFPKIPDKSVTLSMKIFLPDNEAIIITDATKLTQILTNLIGNALKFTQRGFVNFGYTIKDNQLEFYVEDSGIGISLDMQNVIFNRFRQVETTDSRKFGGSGLGLSISKAYAEMLGGKMWLTSELNKGSVFYFTIPYKKVNQKKLPDFASINEPGFEFKKPKTLLIAEDEDSNYMLLEEFLSNVGMNIIRAVNGIEAVELCKINPQIDLVLMDIKMPEMNGYEATIRIKEFKPDLPIIAQTAYSTEIDKNKAFACGCSDFISKPLKRELLLSMINDLLQ